MTAVVCCCAYERTCALCQSGQHAECRRRAMAENGWRADPPTRKEA